MKFVRFQTAATLRSTRRGKAGKAGENASDCKEFIFIHPPAPEKSNYLSAHPPMKLKTIFLFKKNNLFQRFEPCVIEIFENGEMIKAV